MALDCLARCQMTKCPRFPRCPEHWSPEELEEMKPIAAEEKQPTDEVPEMKRCAFGKMMVVMLAGLMLLGGCAGQQGKTTVTDPVSGRVTVTEPGPGMFESENLNKYYKFEGKRADKHAEVATAKITAIIETGQANMQNYTTPIERAQGGLITQMMVANVSVTPPPDGIAPPKTMTDLFDRNLISLLSAGLQAYSLISGPGNHVSDSSMTVSNSGTGSVFVGSNGNSLQNYDLSANGDAGYISGITFGTGVTYTPATTTNTTEGEKTYGLQLF